jgi:hypothetical protein
MEGTAGTAEQHCNQFILSIYFNHFFFNQGQHAALPQ